MSNPFLTYEPPGTRKRSAKLQREIDLTVAAAQRGEGAASRVKVVKSDADAPMMPTAMEKAQRDQSTQMRLHREYWREQMDVARRGQWGQEFRSLEKFLYGMSIDDGDALIDLVKISGLSKADVSTRYMALRAVSNGLQRIRVRNGLPPFDDSLPGEPPTVFEIIRAELGVP